jgi:hypothetical protein
MRRLPASALPPPAVLSREIADAADELACRIDQGEFDDLEEGQMADLRMLSALMAQWAEHAQAIEERLALAHGTVTATPSTIAFCN